MMINENDVPLSMTFAEVRSYGGIPHERSCVTTYSSSSEDFEYDPFYDLPEPTDEEIDFGHRRR